MTDRTNYKNETALALAPMSAQAGVTIQINGSRHDITDSHQTTINAAGGLDRKGAKWVVFKWRKEDDAIESSSCSDNEDTYDPAAVRWEKEGLLQHRYEDSYLRGYGLDHPIHTPDYDWDCTARELKTFINDRHLTDPYPPGVTLKYFYIRILDQADQELHFPLMDLPPEMRLWVYRGLLILNDEGEYDETLYCYPEILRTCKQVYREAAGVLYGENVIDCRFEAEQLEDDYQEVNVEILNVHVYTSAPSKYGQIPDAITEYPDFLRRVSHLSVTLCYRAEAAGEVKGYITLNHLLYALASFLMDGHCLRTIDIILQVDPEEDFCSKSVLYPLRRLRNLSKITFDEGARRSMDDNTMNILKHDMTSSEPAFNTLKHWKLLKSEAVARKKLLRAAHPEQWCHACGAVHELDCTDALSAELHKLHSVSRESCTSSKREENFQAHLRRLQVTLNELNIDKVEAEIKALRQERAARQQYDQVTDDGRLEEAAAIWKGNLNETSEMYASDHDWDEDLETDTLADSMITAAAADGLIGTSAAARPSPEL